MDFLDVLEGRRVHQCVQQRGCLRVPQSNDLKSMLDLASQKLKCTYVFKSNGQERSVLRKAASTSGHFSAITVVAVKAN